MCIRPFEALTLHGGDAHFSYTDSRIGAHPVKCCLKDRTLCLNGACVHQERPLHCQEAAWRLLHPLSSLYIGEQLSVPHTKEKALCTEMCLHKLIHWPVATPFYLHTVQPSYFSIHRHQTVPNAFMAAPPRHPFFAQLILGLERSRNARFKSPGHPLAATGPIYLANSLFRWVSLEVRR